MVFHSFVVLFILSLGSSVLAAPRHFNSPYYPLRREAEPQKWPGSVLTARQYAACTPETQTVRYDFNAMAPADRKAYTDAIKCMRSLPSNLDPSTYPGATNRYLDYAALHIERTLNVHLDGFFLTWHRMFIWLFEQDLRSSCGYNGTQPYWNWPETISDLHGSPIFNGDEYSMSGDGYPQDLNSSVVLSPGLSIPHGLGGGCIMSGPFANWTRTFNTIDIAILVSGGPLPSDAFAKNESCLTRDLNPTVAQANLNQAAIDSALAATSMTDFEFLLNGSPIQQVLGIHSGAHFTIGDPGANIFVSVQDPIWWPLHTMLDNVYIQWQTLHPDAALQLTGTETAENAPPSANVTLDTVSPDWGYFYPSGGLTVRDLINNTAGPFCYRYE